MNLVELCDKREYVYQNRHKPSWTFYSENNSYGKVGNILYDPVQISMIKRENVQLNWIMVHNFYSENDRVFKNDVQSTSPSEQ